MLKNGCMCCSGETPGSELERVLDKLLEMGRLATAEYRGGSRRCCRCCSRSLDYVLIETQGLLEASPLVQVLARREMEPSCLP